MKNISFVYTQSCIYIFIRKELVKKKKKKELFRMVLFLFFFIFFYLLFIFFIHLFTFFYEDNNIDFRIFQRCEISFFFFGNWKLRRNTRNIYIYNALLGLVFLSFIKLFSLYIHWLFFFNRRRNLVFRLSMLHFRFEEGSDVSVRISSFDFVAGRTEENTRRVSEPWIRYLKL